MADASRDSNSIPTLIGASSVDGKTPVKVYADPTTHRLLIDNAGGGSGTVTSVSVTTANGFAGTVATATTTPAITLSTTVTGILIGNGTAVSALTVGTGLQLVGTTLSTTGGGGGTPGTPVNSIQYNNAGSFAGSSTLLFNGANEITFGAEDTDSSILGVSATTADTNGGSLNLQSGNGKGTGGGGAVTLIAGEGDVSGEGGSVRLEAGEGGASGGDGGDIIITAGAANGGNGNGGDVVLEPNAKDGSGTQGATRILNPLNGIYGVLQMSSLASTDKTFTFPNQSGTIALVGGGSSQWQSATYVVSDVGDGDFTDIQSAIDALAGAAGLIFVRSGTYTLSAGLVIDGDGMQIIGEGPATSIEFNSGTVGTAISFSTTDIENCAVKSLKIVQTGTTNTGIGISCGNQPFFQVDSVVIDNCATCIDINDTANLSFYSMYSNLELIGSVGIKLRGNPVNDNTFDTIRTIAAASGIGLDLQVGNGNTFINFNAEPASTTGTIGVKIANSTSNYSNSFLGVYCEGNATGISILGSNASNNVFWGGEVTGNTADISDSGTNSKFIGIALTSGARNQMGSFTTQTFTPITTDTYDVGSTSLRYNNIYLADNGAVNWNNGGVTLVGDNTTGLVSNKFVTAPSFVPNSNTVPTNGMYLAAANTVGWGTNSAAKMHLTTTALQPASNDLIALGVSGTAFADLFLASGGVINWVAGDYTLTHSTGVLTANKDLRVTTAGTNTASVLTVDGTQTTANKTLTSPTIQTSPVLAAATNLKFTVPSSDPSATGITTNEFNSGYSSTAIGDLVYLDTSATWQKADADASAATYSSMLGIALSVAASGAAVNVLLQGFIYAGTPFPTLTIGAPIYMSATAGAITQTAPVTTDSATRIIGYAVHADKMYFNPSNDWITHV